MRERLQPKERSAKVRWLLTVGLLLGAILGMHLLCQMIGTLDFSRARFSSYFHEPVIFALNLLPVALLIVFFYFATNRAWLGFLIPGVLLTVMVFVNYFKVVLRGDPFVAEDLFLIGEAANIVGDYTLRLPLWFFIAIFLLLGGAVLLLRYARGRISKRLWWVRVLVPLLCIGVGALAWTQWYSDDDLFNAQTNYSLFNAWKDAENAASHGFVYSFLHSFGEVFYAKPEGYSDEAAQELLAGYDDAEIPADKQVNLVVTMLESFSDLSEFDSVQFTADPYAAFHALQSESHSGTLITDTVGGGTINAERAFLTGFTYPQPFYRGMTNSFVHYLSAQGYQTDGAHPGYTYFYSREKINARLGFDRYLFMDGYFDTLTDKEHASDAVFFPALRELYTQETADAVPYFSFSVSYQNHGPYNLESLDGAQYVSHEGLNDEAYYQINNYLNGVKDTGDRLAAYVDSFREDETPVVLVFFGDHKPSFGTGNSYYEDMGVNVAEGTAEGCYNLYSTPYLIWANDAAKAVLDFDFTGRGETISPSYLMSVVFDCCGWEGPAWMQCQRQLRQDLPVLHRQTMFLVDGVLTDALPAAEGEVYSEYQIVEYYMRKTLQTGEK